jgi:PKD repeat protein
MSRSLFHIISLSTLLLLPTLKSFSQTDVEFWFVAPEITYGHPSSGGGGEPIYFRVSALELPSTVRIYQPANPAGFDTTFYVPSNSTVSINATNWINDIENEPISLVQNKGIHITATNLITVYYDEDEYYNQDIFSLKGKNALGKEFYTPFNKQWRNGVYTPLPYSAIDIVATEDNTQITVTPTADIIGHAAGIPFIVNLDKGETYSCVATSQLAAGHLGGTHIVSNRPIAVTIKDDSVWAEPQGCKDLIGDQLVPMINAAGDRIVGYEYIVMRGKINLINPNAVPPDPDGVPTGERIFIMATQPNTEVFIDGVSFTTIANPGEEAVYELRNNSTHVRGDKPVLILHVSGFGCEFGGAVLPTIDGCTGSLEVSFTRSTDRDFYLNIMTIDAAKDAFTMYYEDGSTFDIPGTWFEAVGTTGFVCLKKTDKLFLNQTNGGVPQNEVVKITNSVSVFHLGLIEGGRTTGCKYGYFSDYSVSRGGVVVVETGSQSIFRCFGDTVQLRATGGLSYTWSPSTYLDDPFVATPLATPPPGTYNYDVEIVRPCFPDTSLTVIVGIAPEVVSFFEMDKYYICAPDTVNFDNLSTGVDVSSIYNVQWNFDSPGPGYLYDTSANLQHVFTNTDTADHTQTVQLLVWNSQSCVSEFTRDIVVRPEITAGFTNDISDGCQPITVNFTNTSTGHLDRYKWDFGDGNSGNTADASHTYVNLGMADSNFHVELVAISPSYCSDTVTADISVYPYLEADFAIDTFQGCSPLSLSINNNSAGYIEEYEWTFGDGGTSSSSAGILYHTYVNTTAAVIQHNLKLVVKNNTRGCTDTIVRIVSVYPEVTSGFTQDNTSGCNGIEINFTNQSSATASMFEWDFGDGASSSSQHPLHSYENMTGANVDYDVRLVSTTPNLCRDTSWQTIQVHPYIHAEFSLEEFQGCAPLTAVLQNASEGAIASYEWDWGDGSPVSTSAAATQTHIYQNTTAGPLVNSLQLVVENADGCTDTMIRTITVYPVVTSQFTQDVTADCNPLEVTFTNQSSASATSYLWEFGDGGSTDTQHPVHTFYNLRASDTTYTTKLIAITGFGCRDTSQVDITTYSYVNSEFTFSQGTICTPSDVSFTNISVGGASYEWDWGDGFDTIVANNNPVVHLFNNPSLVDPVTYSITLTATNSHNCPSVDSDDITLLPVVYSSFTADVTDGCNPLRVSFTNTSTGALIYNWNFANGQSSNISDPSMAFENFGLNDTTFNVQLVATNVHTCRDTFIVPILVHPFVEADFSIEYETQCSPSDITINNSSVNGQQYTWSFDGTPLVTNNMDPILRQYTNTSTSNTATFNIDLTVDSPQGCISSTSKQVYIHPAVIAGFTSVTEGCSPLQVNYTNTSQGAYDYKWEFGDNSSSILSDPVKIYTNDTDVDALFDVKMTAISSNLCRDSAFTQITVHTQPTAKFTVTNTVDCSPLEITINNTSESGENYEWDFDDGSALYNASDLLPILHTYTNTSPDPTVHELMLNVSTSFGCADSFAQKLTVYPSVEVDFDWDSAGCSPYLSSFTNQSLRTSSYIWSMGDGTSSYISDPVHTFVNNGLVNQVFDVSLTGYSPYGCPDSMTHQVTVYPSPVADFSYSPIYQYFPEATITLDNETSDGTWSFAWDFDDGNASVQEDPGTYTYTDWGEYNIELTASSPQCTDSVVHWIKIFPPIPVADFDVDIDTGCAPLTVSFTNNSQYATEYIWNFDDGSVLTTFEPTYTFLEAGLFQVKLTAIGEGGQTFAFKQIDVWVVPEIDFIIEPSLVMMPDQVAVAFNFSKYGTKFLWDFGDNTTSEKNETEHIYTEPGLYDVSLTVWSEHGCQDYLLKPRIVEVVGNAIFEFPTVFAPGAGGSPGSEYNPNDPSNDVFHPVFQNVIEYHLYIYNRWGELIYETEKLDEGWDGYCGSARCSEGVYIWKAQVKYVNGERKVHLGDITLLHKY